MHSVERMYDATRDESPGVLHHRIDSPDKISSSVKRGSKPIPNTSLTPSQAQFLGEEQERLALHEGMGFKRGWIEDHDWREDG